MPTRSKRKRSADKTTTDKDSPPGKTSRKKDAYTTQQKNAISSLVESVGCNKTDAAKWLKQAGWRIDAAADAYLNQPSTSNGHTSAAAKLFDQYREDPKEEPDVVGVDGTMKMLDEFDISPEDVGVLVFMELVKAPSFGKLDKQGFVSGLSQAGVSEPSKIREVVLHRQSQLAEPSFRTSFKSIYKHTFAIARPEGQKSVPLESAAEFWRLLYTAPSLEWSTPSSPWLDWYLEFLTEKWGKSINKDLWDQTLTFAEKTLEDETLGFWSEDSAWPGVIDEFVEFVVSEKRKGESMEL